MCHNHVLVSHSDLRQTPGQVIAVKSKHMLNRRTTTSSLAGHIPSKAEIIRKMDIELSIRAIEASVGNIRRGIPKKLLAGMNRRQI